MGEGALPSLLLVAGLISWREVRATAKLLVPNILQILVPRRLINLG